MFAQLGDAPPAPRVRTGRGVIFGALVGDFDAFHAESRADVDETFRVVGELGARILDPPSEYGGEEYSVAVFFTDPDGLKFEVVYQPRSNPDV